MFAVIAPALITGAFAGRLNFRGYLKFLILWMIFIYIPVCHWIWGGGFLAKIGVMDFGGGIVIHVAPVLRRLPRSFSSDGVTT